MRTLAACALLLTLSALAPARAPAPVPAAADDRAVKWEYAELSVREVPALPGRKDKNGNETPAAPAAVTIKWISGAEEFVAANWGEAAEKLKAPFMGEPSEASKRVRVLNILGDRGWELVGQPATVGTASGFGDRTPSSTSTLTFKRRR
jgi:hypothetical protein